MLLVTQNATNLFANELRNCLQQKRNVRCIILKLSQIPQKPTDWPSRTTATVERCLGGAGQIYFHENGDVSVFVHSAAKKHFDGLVSALSENLAGASLRGLAFLYELPVDGEALMNLFVTTHRAREVLARTGEKTVRVIVTDDYLTNSLAHTVGFRREKRTVPQILLVEDKSFYQRLVSDLFIKDFMLTIARCGADALDLYIQSAPDLVLLNIGLPDTSGFDVLTRLLELDAEAYVVMLSGQRSRENVLHAVDSGAKDFVAKPFTSEKLLSAVSKCHFVQDKRIGAISSGLNFRRQRPSAGPDRKVHIVL